MFPVVTDRLKRFVGELIPPLLLMLLLFIGILVCALALWLRGGLLRLLLERFGLSWTLDVFLLLDLRSRRFHLRPTDLRLRCSSRRSSKEIRFGALVTSCIVLLRWRRHERLRIGFERSG
jgi:hypothetical protein